MKKQFLSLLGGITFISLTCGAMNIDTGKEMPLKMWGENTQVNYLPCCLQLNMFLISKNNNQIVVSEISRQVNKADIVNILDYQADKAILNALSSQKKNEAILTNNIFKLAVGDSIKKEFNHSIWELDTKTNTYTIILPAPYVNSLKWLPIADIKNTTFKTLWKTAQASINYYLNGLKNNIWPLRSWSGALEKFGSDPGAMGI